MISKVIKLDIESVFKREVRYPVDCEALEQHIFEKCNERVSSSTLKRLFGLIKGNYEPRLYTLDVISKYLGYKNWDEYLEFLSQKSDSDFIKIDELKISELAIGDVYEFGYDPMRKICFKYLGNNECEILHSENSKLKENDIVIISFIAIDYPLLIADVIRRNRSLGAYTAGKISGVTYIRELKL